MSKSGSTVDNLELRPARDADVPSLIALPFSGGLPGKHANRLARQDRDEARYLVAVVDDQIIGHLLLKWDCPEDATVRPLVGSCAEVEDFVVDPALTGRGVGSAMLDHAARLCRARGETRLGLAVGLEITYARGFYERRHFWLVHLSKHCATWLARDPSGREIEEGEDCVYMVKELA